MKVIQIEEARRELSSEEVRQIFGMDNSWHLDRAQILQHGNKVYMSVAFRRVTGISNSSVSMLGEKEE